MNTTADDSGEPTDAEQSPSFGTLREMVREGRGGLVGRLALGRAQLAANDVAGALETLRDAAMLEPRIAAAALALGDALARAGHLPAAIAEFQRALRLDPCLNEARFHLGCAWLEAGEAAKAIQAFSAMAAPGEPLPPESAEKVAEAHRILAAPRAAPGYVRHLFDQFSADYDARMLVQLSYRGHAILRELADLVMGSATEPLAVLDLGCGTGLAGQAFRDLARRLDGVDLSPRMLEKARDRGIYDELILADLESALAADGPAYDLVIAADTLVYLGDLGAVVAGANRRLRPGGLMLFTVEAGAGEGFDQGPKRRYRHSEIYLRRLAESHGFEVAGLMTCVPRLEAKAPIEGFAVALRKPG